MRLLPALFVLFLLLPAAVTQQAPSWTEPFEPVQIADKVYYVGTAGLGAFLFTSEAGHILIDVPMRDNIRPDVRAGAVS